MINENRNKKQQHRMIEVNAAYLRLLEKDSIVLECIDSLDILTLEQWQEVNQMIEQEY